MKNVDIMVFFDFCIRQVFFEIYFLGLKSTVAIAFGLINYSWKS